MYLNTTPLMLVIEKSCVFLINTGLRLGEMGALHQKKEKAF